MYRIPAAQSVRSPQRLKKSVDEVEWNDGRADFSCAVDLKRLIKSNTRALKEIASSMNAVDGGTSMVDALYGENADYRRARQSVSKKNSEHVC